MYKVCLVGCGSIGGNKPDEVDFEGGPVLTHAHAISENPDLEPYMVVDPNANNCSKVADKWEFGIAEVNNADAWDFFDIQGFPELVVIAASANSARAIFDIFSPETEIVILEKPGGDSKEDLKLLAEMAKHTDTEVLLNYQRQYLPLYTYKEITDRIGAVHQITCRYTRGTVRDGSHFIAFLVKLFGMEIQLKNIHQLNKIEDLGKGTTDPTRSVYFELSNGCTVNMIAHDGRVADVFEIEVHGNDGAGTFVEHGKSFVFCKHKQEDTFGVAYKSFEYDVERGGINDLPTDLENGLQYTHKMAVEYLKALDSPYKEAALAHYYRLKKEHAVSLEEGIKIWEILEQITEVK